MLETIYPTETKIFIIWFFIEKVCLCLTCIKEIKFLCDIYQFVQNNNPYIFSILFFDMVWL